MTAFKWHRLRWQADDPVFSPGRLAEGAACGAAMEVDLRATADGDFLCLHDETLDRETTGTGPVRGITMAEAARLRMRDAPGRAPLMLGALAAGMAGAAPGARMQLDFKDDPATLAPAHRARFADLLAPVAEQIILSGAEPEGLRDLAQGLPMAIGYDPCDATALQRLVTADDLSRFADAAIARVPFVRWIYLKYPLVLRAWLAGLDLLAPFRAAGMRVDAYTLNPDHPMAADSLAALIAAGVDQITTDAPAVLPLLNRGTIQSASEGT